MLVVTQHAHGPHCLPLADCTYDYHRDLARDYDFEFVLDTRPFSGRACLDKLDVLLEHLERVGDGDIVASIDADNIIVDGRIETHLYNAEIFARGQSCAMATHRGRLTAGVLFARRTVDAWTYLRRCRSAAAGAPHGAFPWWFDKLAEPGAVTVLPPEWDCWRQRPRPAHPIIRGFHCQQFSARLAGLKKEIMGTTRATNGHHTPESLII